MNRTVTIEMSWMDAVSAKAVLTTRLSEYARLKNDYVTRGEDVPNWLERESEELLRIVQILHEAVISQ